MTSTRRTAAAAAAAPEQLQTDAAQPATSRGRKPAPASQQPAAVCAPTTRAARAAARSAAAASPAPAAAGKRSRAADAPAASAEQEPSSKRVRGRPRKSSAPADGHDGPSPPSSAGGHPAGTQHARTAAAAQPTAAACSGSADRKPTPTVQAPGAERPVAASETRQEEPAAAHHVKLHAAPPKSPTAPVPPSPHRQALASAPGPSSPTRAPPPRRTPLAPSPQRNGAAAAAVATAAAPPTAALSPRRAARAPSNAAPPVASAAAAPAVPKPPAPGEPLSEADICALRRLLQPHALAANGIIAAAAGQQQQPANGGAGGVAGGAGGMQAAPAGAGLEPAGRGAQFRELCGVVTECCTSGRGAAVYVSGLPGTGKTHTVARLLAALPALAAAAAASASPTAAHTAASTTLAASLNCMSLDDPAALYGNLRAELLRAAGGAAAAVPAPPPSSSSAAASADAAYAAFLATLRHVCAPQPPAAASSAAATAAGKSAAAGKKRGRSAAGNADAGSDAAAAAAPGGGGRRVVVVVLDEVDRMLRRREGEAELVRLFQLPAAQGVRLVVLALANSLDLTERLLPALRARGTAPRHMVFTAYSRPQVLAILRGQLAAHPAGPAAFEGGALDLVAKSVSSTTGDLRLALKVCRTALDVLADHNRANPAAPRASVSLREAHAALQRQAAQGGGAAATQAKVRGLPPQQQLLLLALATAVGSRAAASMGPGCGGVAANAPIFTGARPRFADGVAFREIGNTVGGGAAAHDPAGCYEGPTPTKGGGAAAAAATPASRVKGVRGPGGGGDGGKTPGSGAKATGRTPGSSILAGDAGLALPLADVYVVYTGLCRQLEHPPLSEGAVRTDALPGLACDGLVGVVEGRTPAALRLSLKALVRDVQSALADNVMFKRLLGAKAPPPPQAAGGAPVAGGVAVAVRV